MMEAMKTGKYPEYYTFWSRKYNRNWQFEDFPAELKLKGEVVYTVIDEFTILDRNDNEIEDFEFMVEMRD